MNLASRRYYQMRTDGVEFATLSKKLPKSSNLVVDDISKVMISYKNKILTDKILLLAAINITDVSRKLN